jgi:hypothetical protein
MLTCRCRRPCIKCIFNARNAAENATENPKTSSRESFIRFNEIFRQSMIVILPYAYDLDQILMISSFGSLKLLVSLYFISNGQRLFDCSGIKHASGNGILLT